VLLRRNPLTDFIFPKLLAIFAIIFGMYVHVIFGHPRTVTGKVTFPGWGGKFLISGVEEENQ